MSDNTLDASKTAWISRGFEQFVADYDEENHELNNHELDILIVGSGYGGAIAADTLSQYQKKTGADRKLKIAVLERGNEYLPGAFPANSTELAGHIRFGRKKEGLFDFRPGPDVSALVANGVGGGSLINAGVMIRPLPEVLQQGWPTALSDIHELGKFYDQSEILLGSHEVIGGQKSAVEVVTDLDGDPLQKVESLRTLGTGHTVMNASITVASDDTVNSGNVSLDQCVRCGDCVTGCNQNSKNSLDTNLLYRAHRRGVDIYSGATVLNIRRDDADQYWLVETVFTETKLRKQKGDPTTIKTRNLVLAAGMLGSTEILLRSRNEQLPFSNELAKNCSTNGDTMITHYDAADEANAVGYESEAPIARDVGPTISSIIDLRNDANKKLHGLLIEEMASPASMRRVFTELYATVNTLHALGDCDRSSHHSEWPTDDIYEVSDDQIDRTSLYAVMGDDGAGGMIEMVDEKGDVFVAPPGYLEDGVARIKWPGVADLSLFDQEVEALRKLKGNAAGRMIPNPLWQLLPEDMALLTSVERGPVVTVHPLGGCVMADSSSDGVTNDLGQVFSGADTSDIHDGLVILDGSIVPTALAANPSLTIAAIALRAACRLAEGDWDYELATGDQPLEDHWNDTLIFPVMERPRLRLTKNAAFEPSRTEIRLTERMVGDVPIRDAVGNVHDWVVEMTLRTEDKEIYQLTHPSETEGNGILTVAIDGPDALTRSRIRIYTPEKFRNAHDQYKSANEMEEWLDGEAEFVAPVTSGSMRVLERYRSCFLVRIACSLWAFILNHGLRDIWQALTSGGGGGPGKIKLVRSAIALATHAGETRKLYYELTIDDPLPPNISGDDSSSWHLRGEKTFSYTVKSNPWKQLMEMRVREFPGMVDNGHKPVLSLDPAFLARIRVPLIEITKQTDGVTALGEVSSFLAYMARMVVGIHGWSFRAPDERLTDRVPERLPGPLTGIPDIEEHWIDLGMERPYGSKLPEGDPNALVKVEILLTRYPNPGSAKPPLIMMHGYSASGTTFAHNSVENNFASHFYNQGHDVWVLDFRTSCGMHKTARLPWRFEQVAYRDIPEAVNFVIKETGKPKVDVIAHCMGAAMLSMGILYESQPGEFPNRQLQVDLPSRIRRVAFSQVSPLVVMSPANIFRGYVVQFIRELLPDRYKFNPGADASVDERLLDRLLATLPYPEEEFRIENPLRPCARTPWTGTRHRMDVLFGRVFDATNMDEDVLDRIDDFFGPISIDTVTQTINFSRYSMITDVAGINSFVGRKTLTDRWMDIKTQSVNGRNNGLADITTVFRTDKIFDDAGRSYQYEIIDDAGHQDCLIGNGPREQTLAKISEFLDAPDSGLEPTEPPNQSYVAYAPWLGPIITTEPDALPSFRLGTRPTHLQPEGILLLRVDDHNQKFRKPDGTPFTNSAADLIEIMDNAYFLTNPSFRENHWGKFLIPPNPPIPPIPPSDDGDGWLMMVIYNESSALHESHDGYYSFSRSGPNPNDGYLMPVDPATWQRMLIQDPDIAELVRHGKVDEALQILDQRGDTICGSTFGAMMLSVQATLVNQAVIHDQHSPGEDPVLDPNVTSQLGSQVVTEPVSGSNREPDVALMIGTSADNADAALDRLLDHDLDLRDGYVPDLPDATPDECSFLLSSCQYPAGMLDSSVAYHSYRETLRRLAQLGDAALLGGDNFIVPRFGVFAGDQIYADASAGLFDPSVKNGRFRLPYENWLRFPYVRGVMRQVPSYMLLDDHEINDNWEPISKPDVPGNATMRTLGIAGYSKYQRGRLPNDNHYTFTRNGFQFFMLDTRSGRDNRQPGSTNDASLFDESALLDIKVWLKSATDMKPRFIVSPSMLLPRHRHAVQWNRPESAINSDGWDGYPKSLYALLQLIAGSEFKNSEFKNVVFLSGDEHFSNVTQLVLKNHKTNAETVVHSIHTAAAFAPFAFANGRQDKQMNAENIYFSTKPQLRVTSDQLDSNVVPSDYDYECAVTAQHPMPGDGMTYLRVWQDGDRWSLRAEFAKETFTLSDLSAAGLPLFSDP